MENDQSPISHIFLGEVGDPFSSSKITGGLVEFYTRPIETGPFVVGKQAELIDQDGNSYSVIVRAIGRITPDPAVNKWRPGDFLIRVEGISMDQALRMKQIRQKQ